MASLFYIEDLSMFYGTKTCPPLYSPISKLVACLDGNIDTHLNVKYFIIQIELFWI